VVHAIKHFSSSWFSREIEFSVVQARLACHICLKHIKTAKVVLCVKGHIGYLYSYLLLDIYVLNKFQNS
jgi:DMSO reductase anchor subunit